MAAIITYIDNLILYGQISSDLIILFLNRQMQLKMYLTMHFERRTFFRKTPLPTTFCRKAVFRTDIYSLATDIFSNRHFDERTFS